MSCYIVPAAHINALTSWAEAYGHNRRELAYYWQGKRRPIAGDGQRVASVLFAENVRSVNGRYDDSQPAHGHIYRPEPRTLRRSAVEILTALDGYEYQASECDDWNESEACAIVHALRAAAIQALPGYGDTGWCIDTPASTQRSAA